MFLSPHHFQQLDRFTHSSLQFRVEAISHFYWGLTDLEINREALLNGQFSIVSCRGIFPGGTIFQVHDGDGPTPSTMLRNLVGPAAQTVDVYLALATSQISSGNGYESQSRPTRFVREVINISDENSGDNERQVAVARPNLQVLLGEESVAGYDHIKIARLRPESGGAFTPDDSYVPPCLHISCSLAIVGMLRRLLETLHSKSASLSESRSQRAAGMLEYSGTDIGNLWLLHTVNSAIPVVDHFYRVRTVHPELVFISLAQLAAALMTFSPSANPKDLPSYDHNDLSRVFTRIENSIQESLKAVVPTGAVEIALERESDSKFTARIADELLVASQVFLAARADVAESQLIEELPRQAKISSADTINSLLGLALPGVALVHTPIPPHPLRVKIGLQYFRLESRKDPESQRHWDHICKSRTIAVRIPGQRFPALKMELWSIKE